MKHVVILGCFVLAACAARGPSPQTVAELARADQLAIAGCYTCLQDALAIFERELQPNRRAPLGVAARAFETAILIALREKELGIPAEAAIERARGLAARVPPSIGQIAPAVLTELADLTPGEISGLDHDQRDQRRLTIERRTRRDELRPVLDAVQPPALVATYLAATIDCDSIEGRKKLNPDQLLAAHPGSLLLRYRLALCALGPSRGLPDVRQADPRWLDTLFFEGRAAMSSRIGSRGTPNIRGAIDLFTQAHKAFLRSPAIFLALAHAQRAYGDQEAALDSYNGVLAMTPTLREALLGRTITLSHLNRPAEAVETATRMIDLGTWLLPDAYYWRAWNRYALKQIDEAWVDAEQAIKLSANTNVYLLAGIIAYDRKELEVAKNRFENSRKMDPNHCSAHSYLGLVHAALNEWTEATPVFSTAMTCFIQAAAQARKELAELQRESDDPVYTGRLAADRQKTIDDSERKAAEAGYNAAQGFLRAGKRNEALGHLQVALEHPTLQKQAETLKKLIGSAP